MSRRRTSETQCPSEVRARALSLDDDIAPAVDASRSETPHGGRREGFLVWLDRTVRGWNGETSSRSLWKRSPSRRRGKTPTGGFTRSRIGLVWLWRAKPKPRVLRDGASAPKRRHRGLVLRLLHLLHVAHRAFREPRRSIRIGATGFRNRLMLVGSDAAPLGLKTLLLRCEPE